MSPMLAACFMQVWSHYDVKTSGVSLVMFVDDRTFWASVRRATETLTHAKSLSDAFDNMFRFRCRPAKCAIAAPPGVNVHALGINPSTVWIY
jgi:hypothetical protein